MNAQTSALAAVMDNAAAAAAAAPAVENSLIPTNTSAGNLTVQQNSLPAARPSLDSMIDSAGMTVDEYLTIKDAGFRLGDMKGYFKEFEATLDLSEVVAIFSVRANRSGSTTFIKSYDGVTTPQGQNFDLEIRKLQATNDKVDGPYQTSEIPVTLTTEVTDGKVKFDAGTTVGITPAITGVKFFTKFLKQVRAAGLSDKTLRVRIVHTPQSNAKGNEWGVAAFELLGAAE